jgi:hypothetical protein
VQVIVDLINFELPVVDREFSEMVNLGLAIEYNVSINLDRLVEVHDK